MDFISTPLNIVKLNPSNIIMPKLNQVQ